jgi:magnesium-transporting ATPase (P-type)
VLRKLDSNVRTGLTTAEVGRRIGEYGLDKLPEGREQGRSCDSPNSVKKILVYVLLATGFVKLMMGACARRRHHSGVVIINVVLGFFQKIAQGRTTRTDSNGSVS